MTVEAVPERVAAPVGAGSFSLMMRLAWRELRAGIGGFYVFIACIALGVMVITGVGALSDALRAGLERQGETILGGDINLTRVHARATAAERSWLDAQGRVSETATMRAQARKLDGSDQALIELKAVDARYPLVGAVKLDGAAGLDEAIRRGDTVAVEPLLMERLGLKTGDRVMIGKATVTVAAAVMSEPDQLADRLTYGPRVFASHETLEKTGLVQPGTLIRWRYAVKLGEGGRTDDGRRIVSFRDALKRTLPEAGFVVLDRRDPSPQMSRTLDRLRQFLTLIGLTALLVGGVGVANAVSTFIDRRRKVIATMKSLGGSGRLVFGVFLTQVMLMAAIGVGIGLAGGYLVPVVLDALFGDALPIDAELTVTAKSVAIAASYGVLVAALFALWPLGRAERVSPAVLFRDQVSDDATRPPLRILMMIVAVAAALVALAIVSSDAKKIAVFFCIGLVVLFAVFLALGALVERGARAMKRPRRPELALAIGNLGAPGGLTRSVVLSLGAGLSLLVAVSLADEAIVREVEDRLPEQSPNFFLLDIPRQEFQPLVKLIEREAPGARLNDAPMLRGRLVKLNEVPAEEVKTAPEASWVLTGDRGLSYADDVPEGSKLVAGQWWTKDYAGEPLVSFEVDLAKKLGLKIGDTVTVNVLGRNVTARIANLREVNWESLAINFVMVFSPNTLKAAPHNLLATITLPKGTGLDVEARLSREMGKAYPSVTAIRVKDALEAANRVLEKVMRAVRVAGSVTLAAGALVLAGALATAQRRRILEAVILKALGATRRRIMTAHAIEYALLAIATAAVAVLLGGLAAWVALTQVMDVPFVLSAAAVARALGVALALVMVFGGIGTWAVLQARPVPWLRSE